MEKVSGTFCLKGTKGAPHKRCLTPFPNGDPVAECIIQLYNERCLDAGGKMECENLEKFPFLWYEVGVWF